MYGACGRVRARSAAAACSGQHVAYQHVSGYFPSNDETLFGYTNYAMDTPTPQTAGDAPSGTFHFLDSLSPGAESEFDESLAVPESLSVIEVDKKNAAITKELDNVDTPVPEEKGSIPFKSVHQPPVKFKSVHRKVFIPGVEIKVRFIENERSVTTHLINPNLYTILLQHGDYKWTIKKRYKHILFLHQQLSIYRASLNIPFPTKTHRTQRASFKKTISTEERAEKVALESVKPRSNNQRKEHKPRKRKGALPRFPKKPEVMVPYDGIQLRMKLLEDYLYNLLNISIYRNHHETVTFLEVSHLSFVAELGLKGKEGMIEKRTGSTQPGQAGCNCCGLLQYAICVRCNYFCTGLVCAKWQKRWFFVKDTFFGYVRPRDGFIKAVMLFDQGFEVSTGMYSTGLNNGLQILNQSRQLVVKCWTKRKSKEWMAYLKAVANQTAREFTCPNVHHSFAPTRAGTTAGVLVDGSAYLSAVADAMELAREEIFIADWWLSPEIYMKRPALNGDYWRLDKILKRKAAQGVKVFVMLYKEVEMALGINSFYSKSKLATENIKVFRHPDHAKGGVLFWAHHEKIVCVDQTVAFVGGIDLCYGRWDDHKHRLIDLGSIRFSHSTIRTKKKTSSSPGGRGIFVSSANVVIDSNGNPTKNGALALAMNSKGLLQDVEEGSSTDTQIAEEEPHVEQANEAPHTLPILEPGDHLLIAPPKPVVNEPPTDFSLFETPEIQKRNVLNKITGRGKEIISIIYPPFEQDSPEKFDELERRKAEKYAASTDQQLLTDSELRRDTQVTKPGTKVTPLAEIVEGRVVTESSKDIQKVESNSKLWIGKDYTNFIVKDFNNLDLPFVDLVDRNSTPRMPWHDVGVVVQGEAARDVARHFIQRWNAIKLEKARQNTSYPYLLPKTYSEIKPLKDFEHFLKIDTFPVSCQVLRSMSCWSGGFLDPDTVEQSIHEAYVDSITRAQHYIYIENQFFITLSRSSGNVRNQIGEALYNRILRAHKSGDVFRVFVVMPLLPGFEGEVGAPSGTSLHAVTHWNYQSISRSKEAILTRLYEAGIADPTQYITFHGLRTHSVLDGEPITELIYVHSKLLIADDKVVICGSANINDRSMIGKRDSEIAVILQDEVFEEGLMNGQPFPCGRVAGALRKRLFREHLGFMEEEPSRYGIDLSDPVCDQFYRNTWIAISQSNTAVYEDVFHCIPTAEVHSFAELKKYQEDHQHTLWQTEPHLANAKIAQIQGYLVDMPINFLCNEVLTPRTTSMEGMMPTALWT